MGEKKEVYNKIIYYDFLPQYHLNHMINEESNGDNKEVAALRRK